MATGLGKTVTFANIPRQGRMLILSHREELVRQPLKYFQCSTGVEMAAESSHGEEVVSASVQSIARRLQRFSPDDFETIIVDEAHHAAANTYKRILGHFAHTVAFEFALIGHRGERLAVRKVLSGVRRKVRHVNPRHLVRAVLVLRRQKPQLNQLRARPGHADLGIRATDEEFGGRNGNRDTRWAGSRRRHHDVAPHHAPEEVEVRDGRRDRHPNSELLVV